MSAGETPKDIELEIAHVLFIDIVGYSKLSANEQHARIGELNEVVRLSEQFRKAEAANRILKIPTGDGMALVFYKSPEEPAQCAFEIAREVQKNAGARERPQVKLRMGIHSGPVSGVVDVNERTNVAGGGINMAQRVMDCGDAGHILVSHHVAEDLEQFERWRPFLHDIGTFEVKHGVRVNVTNLYSDAVGNPKLPSKLQAVRKHRAHIRWATIAAALLMLGAILSATLFFLRRPITSDSAVLDKSIAVLPFENLSSDKENAYFTDGVQDEILTHLARIADLKVISRMSTMQYKSGAARNLRKIGEELGVAHVVEGSVQRAANKIRVNAQLVDARNDAHLWAQTYDRDLADVFAIQSEIAKAIADQLQAKLSPQEVAAIEKKPTQDTEAYDLYLKAKEVINNTVFSEPTAMGNFSEAIKLLNQAVARDPNLAPAYNLLAEANLSLHWRFESNPEARERARQALETARRLAPDAGETYLSEALFAYWGERDYPRALELMQKATLTLPNNAAAFELMSRIERRVGRWGEATQHKTKAVALDPKSLILRDELIDHLILTHEYTTAEQTADRAIVEFPEKADHFRARKAESALSRGDVKSARRVIATLSSPDAWPVWWTALLERNYAEATRILADWRQRGFQPDDKIYTVDFLSAMTARAAAQHEVANEMFLATRRHYESLLRDPQEQPSLLSFLAIVDAGLGHREEALAEAQRAAELRPVASDPVDGVEICSHLARVYAWTGDRESAIKHLEVVANMPSSPTYGELKFDPSWDELRGDPRFEQIVRASAPK